MIRSVVHSPPPAGTSGLENADPDTRQPDKYADKLVKYIPGEAIAFYTPVYAYVRSNVVEDGVVTGVGALLFVLVISIVGLLGYLRIRSRGDIKSGATPPEHKATNGYFYVLAVLAFLAWAVGTSSVAQDLIPSFPGWWDKVVLLTAVFLIPMIDELLSPPPAPEQ